MEGAFSPIVKKITGEVAGKPKRHFSSAKEVCLGDWWLSKPDEGKGIAVSGRPVEMRRCDNTRQCFSASSKKRFAMREFHSKHIIKRHDCTTLESSDGFIVYLCGFINRYRTQQNGLSSEVCRDFIYGFPINWEVSAAQCVVDEPSHSDREYFSENFLPVAIDAFNGAQLHDLVLSLTGTEREVFTKRVCDNLLKMMNPEMINDMHKQPSKSNPSSPVDADTLTPTKSSTMAKAMNSGICENVNSSEGPKEPKEEKRVLEKSATVLSSRNQTYKHARNSRNSSAENVNILSKAFVGKSSLAAAKNNLVTELSQWEGQLGVETGNCLDQSSKTPFLERLHSADQKPNRKRIVLCRELRQLMS